MLRAACVNLFSPYNTFRAKKVFKPFLQTLIDSVLLDWNFVRILVLVVVALVYAVFDVFNKREVPGIVAYASIAIGVACLATYASLPVAEISAAVSAVIAAAGYISYRRGFLGAGDVFEVVAITLIMPLQPAPLLVGVQPFVLPFVVSGVHRDRYVSIN